MDLEKVMEEIENEIKVAKLSINATDKELAGTVGAEMGLNMRDYNKGLLDAYNHIKKLLKG